MAVFSGTDKVGDIPCSKIHRRIIKAIWPSFYVVMLVGGIFNSSVSSDFLVIAATILVVVTGVVGTTYQR